MAFNKSKVIENAQRFINQGKIAQAIAEYQQILRHEPKDQITLMTIGDLYVRDKNIHQALEYFEKLAQIFLSDGFLSKGIAIYKKISKLAPDEPGPLEKLAELYVQQGVMSEARPIYVQLAEAHMKANRSPAAVEVLRKLVELEPDNQRILIRLAELYVNIGQPKEAAQAYLNAAHRLLDQGDFAEAMKMADRALAADKKNHRAVTIKARALAAQEKTSEAIALLEGLEAAPASDVIGILTELYLQAGQPDRATELAKKSFQRGPEHSATVYDVAGALMDAGQEERALALLGDIRDAIVAAGDSARLAEVLQGAAKRMPGRLEPLEWLAQAYRDSGDSFHLPEALNQLGEAASAAANFAAAEKAFAELFELQPEDEAAKGKLEQVRARLAGAPAAAAEAPAEEIKFELVDEAEVVPAAAEEAELDEETQRSINQALTDVDLFSSYGMTQKAIDLLESVVQRAPRHTGVLEKLLDLYLGAGNERRTAELASLLEQIHQQRGDEANADRFSQLRRRFARAAGVTAEELPVAPPPEFAVPATEAEPVPAADAEPAAEAVEVKAAGEGAVHEVDLSDEWAALAELSTDKPAAEAEQPAEVEAQPAEEAAETIEFPVEVEAAPAEEQAAAEPTAAEEIIELEIEEAAPAAKAKEEAAEKAEEAPAAAMSADQFLSDLADEIGELELTGPAPAPSKPAPAPPPATPPPATPPSQLHEVFEEFRAELGEMGEEVEDLETHYNLGIAYREMGLLDEAIGEFQKVAKRIEGGQTFRYGMQCYTLLGLSFMDKGEPKIAAVWYQKALQMPGLDVEAQLAIRYDLGVAHEVAGDTRAALDSFNQVYASNIDYRDVAERIATLQKKR